MALYEYNCQECKKVQTVVRSIQDGPPKRNPKCKECKGPTSRNYSGVNIDRDSLK